VRMCNWGGGDLPVKDLPLSAKKGKSFLHFERNERAEFFPGRVGRGGGEFFLGGRRIGRGGSCQLYNCEGKRWAPSRIIRTIRQKEKIYQ